MGVAELKRIKELEAEHAKFKRMYAGPAMKNHALKELIERSSDAGRTPGGGRLAGRGQQVPVARACRLLKADRSRWYRP